MRRWMIYSVVFLLILAVPSMGLGYNIKKQLRGCDPIERIGPITTLKDNHAYLCSIQVYIRGQSSPRTYLGKGATENEACRNAVRQIKKSLCP